MELNEIKKELYKQKPIATLQKIDNITKDHWYKAVLSSGQEIIFVVNPLDMGDAKFGKKMEAHLLIRWILINK